MATVHIYRIAVSEGNRTLAILGIPGTQGVFFWFSRSVDYSPATAMLQARPLTSEFLDALPGTVLIDLLNRIIQQGGAPE